MHIPFFNLGILTILGLSVFGGIVNARFFKRFNIPQVLGYMTAGLLLGQTGLGIITAEDIKQLAPINFFCLSVIGFLVGTELRGRTMKKYGRQFSSILFGEGLGAFFVVTAGVFLVLYFVTGSLTIAFAGGIVFGSISSATDPASTIAVLWEYRTAGILTITLTAIVALDDALAMTLYGTGSGLAQIISGGNVSILHELGNIFLELFGSVALGGFIGLILSAILKRATTLDGTTGCTIGLLLFLTGIIDSLNMDVILASMAAGVVIANRCPSSIDKFTDKIKSFSTPIYVLFFVFVGARLKIASMPSWLWIIVLVYVVGRSAGKMIGANLGGKVSGADQKVVKYCGLGLFAQGGVAVGLSIMAGHHLQNVHVVEGFSLGDTIISGVTATTFIIQIIGPPLVKLAAKRADEIGKNITEEDITHDLSISDIMNKDLLVIDESMPLQKVFDIFSNSNLSSIPVVSSSGDVTGSIGMDELRESIMDRDSWAWIIATDIQAPLRVSVKANDKVAHFMSKTEKAGTNSAPVLENGKLIGTLTRDTVRDVIRRKLLESTTV